MLVATGIGACLSAAIGFAQGTPSAPVQQRFHAFQHQFAGELGATFDESSDSLRAAFGRLELGLGTIERAGALAAARFVLERSEDLLGVKFDVKDANEATVELSKDNWFFGVRAYDKEGYRSPVAFAGMGR